MEDMAHTTAPERTSDFIPVVGALVEELGLIPAAVFGFLWQHRQAEAETGEMLVCSIKTIAEGLKISLNTVRRALRALCAGGYLENITPERRHAPHIYRLTDKARELGIKAGYSGGQIAPLRWVDLSTEVVKFDYPVIDSPPEVFKFNYLGDQICPPRCSNLTTEVFKFDYLATSSLPEVFKFEPLGVQICTPRCSNLTTSARAAEDQNTQQNEHSGQLGEQTCLTTAPIDIDTTTIRTSNKNLSLRGDDVSPLPLIDPPPKAKRAPRYTRVPVEQWTPADFLAYIIAEFRKRGKSLITPKNGAGQHLKMLLVRAARLYGEKAPEALKALVDECLDRPKMTGTGYLLHEAERFWMRWRPPAEDITAETW